MNSKNQIQLQIAHTWDGLPLQNEEHVHITLLRQGNELHIQVEAPFYDDPAPSTPAGPTDGLWEYEVVECFFAGPQTSEGIAYTEIELSPHGHHLVLQLEDIRQATARCLPITYQASIEQNRWKGEARMSLSLLPEGPLTCNAYAISGQGDKRRYCAMTPVPGPHPDFHRLQFFSPLELDLQKR